MAVGRKNWLFSGFDTGAERTAILFSVQGTCALAEAEPYAVLRDVLERLGQTRPPRRVHELLPATVRRTAGGARPIA